jgi:predicted alpha/beta hydrolase family esterase
MPRYVLVLPGYTGSGPAHWQSWLAVELANRGATVDVPRLTDPDHPDVDVWLRELREHLALAPRDAERIALTHSCGALLWLHHAAGLTDRHEDHLLRFDRVLLASPPGPGWHNADVVGFLPAPLGRAGIRRAAAVSRMVAGDDDPYCPPAEARAYARSLDVELDVIPAGGHLNTASGYGTWPSVLDWSLTGVIPLEARAGP